MTYIALVTGASSGIGEAIATRLAQQPDTHVIIVARREQRLRELANRLGAERITVIAADLTDPEVPGRIAAQVSERFGQLNLLVNNAGARWSGEFPDVGWENIGQHMLVNFEAPVRLIEALLPLLRETRRNVGSDEAPSSRVNGTDLAEHTARLPSEYAGKALKAPVAIVNITSTSGRVARKGTSGYAASKFALSGFNDSLAFELAGDGIHVGMVLPGFISTEGFPQQELKDNRRTRFLVSDAAVVVDAVLECGPGGRAERYAPKYYGIFAAARILAPGLMRRSMNNSTFTPSTGSD
jgi:uncharacterized protein